VAGERRTLAARSRGPVCCAARRASGSPGAGRAAVASATEGAQPPPLPPAAPAARAGPAAPAATAAVLIGACAGAPAGGGGTPSRMGDGRTGAFSSTQRCCTPASSTRSTSLSSYRMVCLRLAAELVRLGRPAPRAPLCNLRCLTPVGQLVTCAVLQRQRAWWSTSTLTTMSTSTAVTTSLELPLTEPISYAGPLWHSLTCARRVIPTADGR